MKPSTVLVWHSQLGFFKTKKDEFEIKYTQNIVVIKHCCHEETPT